MAIQSLIIIYSVWEKMREHVDAIFPEEACGLLAGVGNQVSVGFPMNNILKSQHRYRMDALEQLTCFLEIEQQHLELLGIYHSHPHGSPYPSERDVNEAYYPDTPYLIWAPNGDQWNCQAFLLKNQAVTPIKMVIEKA